MQLSAENDGKITKSNAQPHLHTKQSNEIKKKKNRKIPRKFMRINVKNAIQVEWCIRCWFIYASVGLWLVDCLLYSYE